MSIEVVRMSTLTPSINLFQRIVTVVFWIWSLWVPNLLGVDRLGERSLREEGSTKCCGILMLNSPCRRLKLLSYLRPTPTIILFSSLVRQGKPLTETINLLGFKRHG